MYTSDFIVIYCYVSAQFHKENVVLLMKWVYCILGERVKDI